MTNNKKYDTLFIVKIKTNFKYGNLLIDKINSTDSLVPTEALEIELSTSDKKALAIAINQNLPALIIGETGTGKTSAVKQLAFLRQQPYVRVNMTGYTTPDELIGSKSVKDNATYYENGIITDAMQRGAILVIDEINATTPDCLFILHGLLDEDKRITLPNGEVVTPHKDFRVFATCNPDYEGTKSMNKAFIDRFPIILAIDILSPKKEQKLLMDRQGIDEVLATDLITVATMARKAYFDNQISTFISTRGLLHIANLIKQGLEPKEAYQTSIVRKTSNKEEQQILNDFFASVFKQSNEPDNQDKPIVTTQRELNNLKTQVNDFQTDMELYRTRENDAINLKREMETELSNIKEKTANYETENTELTKKIKEAEQTILTYKRLEDMIKSVASKSV